MDIRNLADRSIQFVKKYRYVAIVLLVGLILMALPETEKKSESTTPAATQTATKETMEDRLSSILSQISGAGEVRVLLTEAVGEEVFYQTNDSESSGENTSDKNINTVIVTDAQRTQSGLIRQINPPAYRGAIVLCQGADDPKIQLAIVDAVSKITGLGANRISVMKMK